MDWIRERYEAFTDELLGRADLLLNQPSTWQFDLPLTLLQSGRHEAEIVAAMYASNIDGGRFRLWEGWGPHKYSYAEGLHRLWSADPDCWPSIPGVLQRMAVVLDSYVPAVPPPSDGTGFWTEREVYMALAAAVAIGNEARAGDHLAVLDSMLTPEWALLHGTEQHEGGGSRRPGDPDKVFSPWMSALLIHTLDWCGSVYSSLKPQCDELILNICWGIELHGTYVVDSSHPDHHPALSGRRVPYYLAGPNGTWHDQNSWDNAHHALDVATALSYGYAREPSPELLTVIHELLSTAEWQCTVRWPSLPGGRQFNWSFGHGALTISERLATPPPPPPPPPPVTLTEPDWGPLDGSGMPVEAELIGTAPIGNPWLAAVFPDVVIAIDHSTANVSGQADLYERVDGTWQPPRTIVWPFGGHAPEIIVDAGEEYWIGEDRGHISYGEVYRRQGSDWAWDYVPDSPLQARARVVHGDPGLPWPEGVPQPVPGDWSAARFRYRFWDNAGVEIINFCGEGAEPLAYVNGLQTAGFWLPTGDGIADLAAGTFRGETALWPEGRTPWHWDGWAEMVGHVLVLYSRHQPNSGVFWRDESGQWHEKCRTQWGHQLTVNWFKSRLISVEGRIDRVDIRDGKVYYSKGR